ncbi:MAG: TPM domain-containing protein [Acutalibacteraceae bacterium]|nr:TPM domain-containing protein [Acutalibacteraceae bacterium]
MKNKTFAILTVLVLCLTMVIPVSAAGTYIFDNTNMIGQLSSLEAVAQNIEDTYGFSVLLTVTDTTGDKTTYEYGEALYEANAAKADGLVLIYDYGANVYNFYRAGKAEELFTNDILEGTVWNAFAYTETYYDGAVGYYSAVESILKTNNVTAPVATTEPTTEFVPTDRTLPLVVDNADVLTDAEEADFTAKLEELGGKYDLEIGILTVDTYEGKDGQAYADDFYDYNGYGYGENDDGLMIVFNTGKEDGTRNITLTTHGTAIDYITDLERDVMFEMMITELSNGEYAAAFETFISEADSSIDPSIPVFFIPLSVVVGFALAFLIVKIQASKLKTVRQQVNAADYVGNVNLTYQADNFIYRNVSKVKRSSESSSGGSSTHTSSSGRTHGGGSRNF